MMYANLLLIVQAMYSTSKGQSVCYSTGRGGFFCHVFSFGPLFIRMECQIKNGTLNFLTLILVHSS